MGGGHRIILSGDVGCLGDGAAYCLLLLGLGFIARIVGTKTIAGSSGRHERKQADQQDQQPGFRTHLVSPWVVTMRSTALPTVSSSSP